MSVRLKLVPAVAALGFVGLLPGTVRAQATSTGNLVANGGFETGSFDPSTNWVVNGNVQVGTTDPRSGLCAAEFGGGFGQISEGVIDSLATTPGQSYTLTFFLDAPAGTTGAFSFGVGDLGSASAVFVPVSYTAGTGYQEFTASYTAASGSGSASFRAASGSTGRFSLDDVSLAPSPVPEASSVAAFGLLLTLGAAGTALQARRSRKRAA